MKQMANVRLIVDMVTKVGTSGDICFKSCQLSFNQYRYFTIQKYWKKVYFPFWIKWRNWSIKTLYEWNSGRKIPID